MHFILKFSIFLKKWARSFLLPLRQNFFDVDACITGIISLHPTFVRRVFRYMCPQFSVSIGINIKLPRLPLRFELSALLGVGICSEFSATTESNCIYVLDSQNTLWIYAKYWADVSDITTINAYSIAHFEFTHFYYSVPKYLTSAFLAFIRFL